MICVNVFFMYSETKFLFGPDKNGFFLIDPHCKSRPLWQCHAIYRHDFAKVGDFLRWGYMYGDMLCLLSDPAEISFLTTLKTFTHIV